MRREKLISNIRNVPDFPIPGIQFKDVTTLFKDSECLQILSDIMYEMYKDKGITNEDLEEMINDLSGNELPK